MCARKALITGITGQDGSYLAEILCEQGYEVYGMVRRASNISTVRIDHLPHGVGPGMVETYFGDLADANSIVGLLVKLKPDEIYNIGSMSHVRVSFEIPEYTAQVTGLGPTRILEAIRSLGMDSRYYQASSSEMFGISPPPQGLETPMLPQSPYGCAKLYAYHMTKAYRKGYGMWAANGILFNHESPRRGETFVTKKIVRAAVRIKLGRQSEIQLGNLDSSRDWGHARDYMEAVYLIMHTDVPQDWVVSTGEAHSVRDFAVTVFGQLGLDFERYEQRNAKYFRPNEVPALLGDSSKIRERLGWRPKYSFEALVQDMIDGVMKEETGEVARPNCYEVGYGNR